MVKDRNVMVRVSKQTHDALKRRAAGQGLTMSQVVRHCIDLFLRGEIRIPRR